MLSRHRLGRQADCVVDEAGEGSELKRCQDEHFRVWTDGPTRLTWPEIVYFVVRPKWIRYSDTAAHPGNSHSIP